MRSSELLRGGGDLIRVAGRRLPRQPQRVVVVARDDVDVKVEHGLPGGLPARVQEVDSVGFKALLGAPREPLSRDYRRLEILMADLQQVANVIARHDERVSSGRG